MSDKAGGLQEIVSGQTPPSNPPPTSQGEEKQFEVTYGDEVTELFASNLATLLADTAEGLEIEPSSFIVKYTNDKGKEITVKTENNFKVMTSKAPNADGVYEVRVELKGAAKPEEPKEEAKPVHVPTYNAVSANNLRPD